MRAISRPAGGRAGFTLMELVVVIVLISLMFAAVIPRLDLGGGVGDLEKAVRIITAQLESARREAISGQKPQFLVLDLSAQKVGRKAHETASGDSAASEEKKPKLTTLPDGVSFIQAETPDDGTARQGQVELRISREGYVEQAAVQLTDKNRKLTLFFEPFLGGLRQVEGVFGLDSQSG